MKEGGYFGCHGGVGGGWEMGERLIWLYFVDNNSSSWTVGRQKRHVLFVGARCNLIFN